MIIGMKWILMDSTTTRLFKHRYAVLHITIDLKMGMVFTSTNVVLIREEKLFILVFDSSLG